MALQSSTRSIGGLEALILGEVERRRQAPGAEDSDLEIHRLQAIAARARQLEAWGEEILALALAERTSSRGHQAEMLRSH